MAKKIYLILDEKDSAVVEAIRQIEELQIVQWDYSYDTAHQFLSNNNPEADIILCSEFVQVSTIVEGKQVAKDTALLSKLRDIKVRMPKAKIILLCNEDRALPENKSFLSSLVTLNIYDFYTETSFTPDSLKAMLLSPPRDFSQVYRYLPSELSGSKNDFSSQGFSVDIEEENRYIEIIKKGICLGKKYFKPMQQLFKKPKNSPLQTPQSSQQEMSVISETPLVDKPLPKTSKKYKPGNVIREKATSIYSIGIENENVIDWKTWENLVSAINISKPDGVILTETPDLKEKIKEFKSMFDIPLFILGEIDFNPFEYGADDCFTNWSNIIVDKFKMYNSYSTDHLTGLFDRRSLESLMSDLNEDYSVLICDLDFFKKINDTYGHQAGDEVLVKFSSFMSENIRSSDIIARFGGEEFVVVFPEVAEREAKIISDKLRQNWQTQNVYGTTFSGGISGFKESFDNTVKIADELLYKAKNNGRNMICASGEGQKMIRLIRPKNTDLQIWVVCGTSSKVGTTSFASALFKMIDSRHDADLVDAGGGASRYKECRTPPPYAMPGTITIVDAGTKVPDNYSALATYYFIVTDMCDSTNFRNFITMPGITCIVGNRGALPEKIEEAAKIWKTKHICLGNVPSLPKSYKEIVIPKKWHKQIKNIVGEVIM